MNLSELKKKHAEMGKEIERLEKKREPLTFADLKLGHCFRAVNYGFDRRIKVSDTNYVWLDANGLMGVSNNIYDGLPVILQDDYGNDLPPEKQVKG